MGLSNFTEKFFEMEVELKLFEKKNNLGFWWDPVRFEVFNHIYRHLSAQELPQVKKFFLKRIHFFAMCYLLRLWLNIKIKFLRYEVVVFRVPRNIGLRGEKIDVVLDDIIANIDAKKLVINTYPYFYHIKLNTLHVPSQSSFDLSNLNTEVEKRFGVKLDVESFIKLNFFNYQGALKQYERLINLIRPKLILLVQNGIQKALFEAAHMQSITVIEAQHCAISHQHLAYSYPKKMESGFLKTLPDMFLIFSDFWAYQCNYPVKKKLVIGNNYYGSDYSNLSLNSVLVISNRATEKDIEKLLIEAALAYPNRHFIYKLHPTDQLGRKKEIQQRMENIKNIDVILKEESIQKIMRRCSAILCVRSTACYEALQFGLNVFILAKLNSEVDVNLRVHKNLYIVNNAKDFISGLSLPINQESLLNAPVYFRGFNPEVISEIIDGILN